MEEIYIVMQTPPLTPMMGQYQSTLPEEREKQHSGEVNLTLPFCISF